LLRLVAAHADGWNTCWAWTLDAYRERLAVLERACEAVDRDPATVWRTLGLYALVGDDETDLRRRFERLRDLSPPGIKTLADFDDFRTGRLVGTTEQVRERWASGGPRHRHDRARGGCRAVPGHRPRRCGAPGCGPPLSLRIIRGCPCTVRPVKVSHVRSRCSRTHHHPPDRLDHLRRVEAAQLARSLGQAQKEFKSGLDEGHKPEGEADADDGDKNKK
jgi:hypothetical protein